MRTEKEKMLAGELYVDVPEDRRLRVHDVVHVVRQPKSDEDMQRIRFAVFDIIELRPKMGLRSPVHTVARSINPFNAPYVMQGIFHPGYRPMHQEAAQLLGESNVAVIKGEGGEIERNPDTPCLVQRVHNGQLKEEEWPALFLTTVAAIEN